MTATPRPRTYNQNHVARPHTGGRRISIYWTWSYPWEAQRDPASMTNRFSTITEVRNVLWPAYETPEYDAANFLQGIAGTLELFHRSALAFQELAEEATGHPVAVYQRIDQAGYKLPIDERVLADTDTLMVFGLDHLLGEQEAAPEEIAAITEWLKREGTCLLLAPHHDVGFTDDYSQRQMEYEHHGDRLVPAPTTLQPVHPLADAGTRRARSQHLGAATRRRRRHQGHRATDRHPRPRQPTAARQRHHLQLPPAPAALRTHRAGKRRTYGSSDASASTRTGRIHSQQAGNTEFNALIWMPPAAQRAGDIVLIDSTHFTTLFGGTDSLRNLWHNLATMK